MEEILQILKSKKMRLTRTREAFVALLSESPAPLSAASIVRALARRGVAVDKTTVYREIERFMTLGLLEEVGLGDRQKYYELSSRHHHHLVCIRCDGVEDVDIDERDLKVQEASFARKENFQVLRHSLEFFGLCQECHSA